MDHDQNVDTEIQQRLDEPMPWIGLYIALASAVCTLAIAADAFNGFRSKKLWFPCKYFSLNAASLTLLAVAMKLPMDLNTDLTKSLADWSVKDVSLTFMSTVLANFMTSLGSMNNKEILANVVALGILVVTIAANVWIQFFLLLDMFDTIILVIYPSFFVSLLLSTFVSLAITVPTAKRNLETKYQEKHKAALREEDVLNRREVFQIDNQRGEMMKYWVMAETSSPQFVIARSAISTTSAIICLFAVITLILDYGELFLSLKHKPIARPASPYGEYTIWIQVIQFIGMVVGAVEVTLRWLVVVSFKCSTINWNSFKKGFKIEAYWIQTLVDWRDNFSALQLQQTKCRRYLHDAKWFILTLCIGVQILIVLASKLLVFLSALLISPFFFCFTYIKKFIMQQHYSDVMTSNQSGDNVYLNLSRYVLLLEGEVELPRRILKNICHQADSMIQKGRQRQPRNLINLLHNFVNFSGVGQFDTSQIPSLHSKEPPNCWTLPVVTLTTIAVALPNITKQKGKQLLSSVREGLSLTRIVEKTLNNNAELVNINKAAYVSWAGVLLYMRWLEINVRETSLRCKSSKEVLEELANEAEGIIMEFKKEVKDSLMENPLNWPVKIVAANSMYRISRTVLLSCEGENVPTDEQLFEQLSNMIADILAACLTNLPHVITTMCYRNAIEKRENSVRKAFLLLGKTEQVLELLQQREWPYLDHDKATNIEEWRALFRKDEDDPATSASSSRMKQ